MQKAVSSFLKKYHLVIPLTVIAVLLIGVLAEGAYYLIRRDVLHQNSGITALSVENAEYEGFHPEADGLVFDHEEAYIRIPLSGQYIGQFACSYDYEGLFNITAEVSVINEYGETHPSSVRTITDKNAKVLNTTYLDIYENVDSIQLNFSPAMLDETGLPQYDFDSYPLTITGFQIVNVVSFNWYRVLLIWGVLAVIAALVLGRRFIRRHIEWGFLAIALTVGTVTIFCLPANKVSWDEEVHFHNLLAYASYPENMNISRPILMEFSSDIDTWLYNQPDNAREQALLNDYLNTNGNYKSGENALPSYIEKKYIFVYMGEAIVLKLCKLFSVPFGLMLKLGRFGNLIPYCLLMFLAIRKTPIGKAMLTFIALLPTSMYMACAYSYDPLILGCVALFFAMLMEELAAPERPLALRKLIVMCLIFAAGVVAKAVYAPLLLTLCLLPATKFAGKKQHRIMLGIMLIAFLALMSSFVLPALFHPSETGDLRGGATSEAGQMSYILSQPFAYAKILFCDIIRKVPDFFFGVNGLGNLGDLNYCTIGWFLPLAMIGVFLTDVPQRDGLQLKASQRIILVCAVFLALLLVWTSMYIAFTVPGSTKIEGVQGRYFLYFLFPLALALRIPSISNSAPKERYHLTILGLCAVISFATVYLDIYRCYCR